MNRCEARELLDAAKAGIDVPTSMITAALRETGDLTLRHDKRLLIVRAAKTLIEHYEAGRCCDPLAIDWALAVLAANGDPYVGEPVHVIGVGA